MQSGIVEREIGSVLRAKLNVILSLFRLDKLLGSKYAAPYIIRARTVHRDACFAAKFLFTRDEGIRLRIFDHANIHRRAVMSDRPQHFLSPLVPFYDAKCRSLVVFFFFCDNVNIHIFVISTKHDERYSTICHRQKKNQG